MDVAKLLEQVKNKQKAMARRERTVKCNPGKNRVRILPGWRKGQEEVFFHDFGQHYVKDESGEVKAVYVCTEKTFGKPCAVCQTLGKALKATKDDTLTNLLGEAKASERILVNAIMLDGEDPSSAVILELPPSVFRSILALFEEWGNVIDPAEGRDLIITREGKGISTKYTVSPAAKASAVPAAVLAKLHNLDEYVAQESTEQQARAITAIASVAGLLTAPASAPSTAPKLSAPSDTPLTKVPEGTTTIINPAIEAVKETDVVLDEDLDALLEVGT